VDDPQEEDLAIFGYMLNMKIIFLRKKSFYVLFVGYLLELCIGKSWIFLLKVQSNSGY
jgi:hypothetical protein